MSWIKKIRYLVGKAEVTKSKDLTKKMKDTFFMENKVENHVVDEDPQKRIGNLFVVVNKGEEDDTTFWQPIWSRKFITLFQTLPERPMTHVFFFSLKHKPKSSSNLALIPFYWVYWLTHTQLLKCRKPIPNWIFFALTNWGFPHFLKILPILFIVEDFLNNLVIGFIGFIMKDWIFFETETRISLLIWTQSTRDLYKESHKKVVIKGVLEGSGGTPEHLN